MFIRSKVVKGRTYYQAVEGYRDASGKVRHRTLASLGRYPTTRAALDAAEQDLAFARELLAIWERDGYAEQNPDNEAVKRNVRQVAKAAARVDRLRSIVDTEHVRPAAKVAAPLDRVELDAAIDAAFAGACTALAGTTSAIPTPSGPTQAMRGSVAGLVKLLASEGQPVTVAAILDTLGNTPGYDAASVGEVLDSLKASGDYDRLVS